MLCFRYRKLLVPYAEGTLDGRTCERVRAHVDQCERCAAGLRAIESMSKALSLAAPHLEPADDLWARVSKRIADKNISPTRRVWLPQTVAAGFVALLIVVGFVTMRPGVQVVQVAQTKSASVPEETPAQEATSPQPNAMAKKTCSDSHKSAVSPRPKGGVAPERTEEDRPVMMAKLPAGANISAPSRIRNSLSIRERSAIEKHSDNEAAAPEITPTDSKVVEAPVSQEEGVDLFYAKASDVPNDDINKALDHGKSDVDGDCSFGISGSLPLASSVLPPTRGGTSSVPDKVESECENKRAEARCGEMARTASQSSQVDPANAPRYYADLGFAYDYAGLGKTEDSANKHRYALDHGNSDTWAATAASIRDAKMLPGLLAEYSDRFIAENDPKIGAILFELQSVANDACGMLDPAQKLLKIDPDDPSYILKLGEAYECLGNKREARAVYERLASGSDSEYAATAKAKIAAMDK